MDPVHIDELDGEALDRALEEAGDHIIPEAVDEIEHQCSSDIQDMLYQIYCYATEDLSRAGIDDERWEYAVDVDGVGGHIPDVFRIRVPVDEPRAMMSRKWNDSVPRLQEMVDSINSVADELDGGDTSFDFNGDEEMADALYREQEIPIEELYDAWRGVASQCLELGVRYMKESIDSIENDSEYVMNVARETSMDFTIDGHLA